MGMKGAESTCQKRKQSLYEGLADSCFLRFCAKIPDGFVDTRNHQYNAKGNDDAGSKSNGI